MLFNFFPLYHANARYNTVLIAFIVDGTAVLHDRFSVSTFWATCRREGVTAFNYMGAVLMMLHKQPEHPDDAENPVRRAFGAPAPVEIFEDFQDRFGVQLVEVYGSTELGIATMNTVEEFRLGSCGRAAPSYEIEIHDEHDGRCTPGVTGEIVARSRQPYAMFSEYVGMPAATVAAFTNQWFHTGDRGRMDDDGYVYYVDRMKDCIRRRGENISSWEVERTITTDPSGRGGDRRCAERAERGGGAGRGGAAARRRIDPAGCSTTARSACPTSPCRASSASSASSPRRRASASRSTSCAPTASSHVRRRQGGEEGCRGVRERILEIAGRNWGRPVRP